MNRVIEAFTRRSLVVQLGVLVLACQLLAHVVTILVTVSRSEGPDPARFISIPALKAGALAEILTRASESELETVLRLIKRSGSGVRVVRATAADVDTTSVGEATRAVRRLFPAIADQVGIPEGLAGPILPVFNVPDVYLRIDGTRALVAPTAVESTRVPIENLFLRLTLFLVVIPIALGTIWALRTLTAPLRQFAATADRFAEDLDPTPIPLRGSAEMRSLAHAFNTMRGRISELLEGRSRMLAAVSHDLRTPLTRIRLRLEAGPASDDRDKSLRDITAMDKMIAQSLAYLRDSAARPAPKPVDLSSLVASVADDFSDAGGAVSFVSPGPIIAEADPDGLVRAVGNLVENALKFGSKATLSIREDEDRIVIDVADDGPGISGAERARVFEPFARGDAARTGATGFGLGLAIARQIVEHHGGRIELADGTPRGLVARIVLPHRAAARTAARRRAA